MMLKNSADALTEKLAARFTRPAIYNVPLATEQIAGPLQFTKNGVYAWFVMDAVNWECRTNDERVALWDQHRAGWGQIATGLDDTGMRPFHMRRTTRPHDVADALARLDADSDWLPAVDGCEDAETYLAYMGAQLSSANLDRKMVAVGVWLGTPPSAEAIEDLVEGSDHPAVEATRLIQRLLDVETVMAEGGLSGKLATADDMAFLMHRSLSMGIPAPEGDNGGGLGRWFPAEMGGFLGRREWVHRPFTAQPVIVEGGHDGSPARRWVVTLRMDVLPPTTWPESGASPWLEDQTGVPVEVSVNGDLWTGPAMQPEVRAVLARAKGIREHHEEHELEVPAEVARQIEEARDTYDQVTEGDPDREAWRAKATVCVSVYGTTQQEADDNARKVQAWHKLRGSRTLVRTTDQARAQREQVPGEPRVTDGWTRVLTPGYMAATINVDSVLGTESGFYLGSSLSQRAVLFNPHWLTENNRPGMITIDGEPGSGKSYLGGSLIFSMVTAGVKATVWDPSGLLGKLTKLPQFAPYAAEINLARAGEGTMSPPQMIPIPRKESYRDSNGLIDQHAYMLDKRAAEADAEDLSLDVLRMMLPPRMLRREGVDQRLVDAIRSMRHHPAAQREGVDRTWHNLRWALEYLQRRNDDLGRDLWRELDDAAAMLPSIIPVHAEPVRPLDLSDKRLVVFTMPGVQGPPEGKEPDQWGRKERLALPLLHLAAFLTARDVYEGDRDARKAVFVDEGDALLKTASGRALVQRLGSDTRKWNTIVIFASQDPLDRLAAGKRIQSLISVSFVGRLSKRPAAERGCEALDISAAHAPLIQNLRTGEFFMSDQESRVGWMRVDGEWHPSLPIALNTTPGKPKEYEAAGLRPPPVIDERLLEKIGARS